ncbi:efflux RND transporter permease subunit, partial [Klebsiella pneumoniae]
WAIGATGVISLLVGLRPYRLLLATLLLRVLHWPKTTLLVAALSIFTVIWPLSQVGGEFLPKINEGDLLYMPSTLPGVSPAEAAALLQTTDKLIKSVPEVASVFGKTGKAET